MKKSFALAAAAAALSIAGSASALDSNRPIQAISILGGSPIAGAGRIRVDAPSPGFSGYCNYTVEWTNPLNQFELALCPLLETKVFGLACPYASVYDVTTALDSGPNCYGYNAAGYPVSVVLHLQEFAQGQGPTASTRAQGLAFFSGTPYIVRVR